MHRLNVIAPTGLAGRAGAGDTGKQQASEFSSNDGANVKPDLLAMHYCACRPGATCIFCLRWHRKITGIEQRRADAIRQQALYRRIAGGL